MARPDVPWLAAAASKERMRLLDDFADLNRRLYVGEVRDIPQDLFGVGPERRLEITEGVKIQVPHGDVGGRLSRRASCKA